MKVLPKSKKTPGRARPVKVYEVYSPMPYCEVYRVPASSKAEARKLFEQNRKAFECIGEVSSRRKIERLVK